MTALIDHAIRTVRIYAHRTRMRPATLAKAAGLGPNTLARMGDEDWNPSADTIREVEKLIPSGFVADVGEHEKALSWIRSGVRNSDKVSRQRRENHSTG